MLTFDYSTEMIKRKINLNLNHRDLQSNGIRFLLTMQCFLNVMYLLISKLYYTKKVLFYCTIRKNKSVNVTEKNILFFQQ